MNYTEINGKQVSQISLGTVQLGMNYGIANKTGQPKTEQCLDMLECAVNNGITAIDTAHEYGASEEVLGSFLRQYHGIKPFITSKFMTKSPSGSSYNEIECEIFSSVEESLNRLGINKLDCLLLHRASDITAHGNYVELVLHKLLDKKYIDIAGVSVYTGEEIDEMLKHDIYKAIQLPMNILDRRLLKNGYIKKLNDKNISIFVRSVFWQGLFFLDENNLPNPALAKYAKKPIEKLHRYAQNEGMSTAELAIAYIRDIAGITSLVLGSDTRQQVIQNIEYFKVKKISGNTLTLINNELSNVNIAEIMKALALSKKQ